MDDQHITVKRVTKDDYNKVMDMFPPDEIYNGADYLPDNFHMLLDMPNNEAYAAMIGDKFVSFVLYTMVDDGKTVVSRAGRTRKGYERRGLSSILLRQFQKISMRGQTLQYEIKTGELHQKRLMDTLEKGQRHIVLKRDLRNFICSSAELNNQLADKVHITSSVKMAKKDFVKLFMNDTLVRKFFPEGRLLIDRVPYRAIQSNASFIITERTHIVTSDLHDPARALLTFMNYFHAPLGLVCKLDTYGSISSALSEHLVLHLNIPQVRNYRKVLIRCFCKEGTNWRLVSGLMSEFGLKEFAEKGSTVICTEQMLMKSSNL